MIQGVTTILNADTTFRSLTGLNKAGVKYKAYPVVCPIPEEPPYAVVYMSSKVPFGECKGSFGTFEHTFEVSSFEKNFEQVVTLDEAVIDALVGKTGLFNGFVFQEIRFNTTRDEAFSKEYNVFSRVSSFTAVGYANTTT